MTANVLTGPFMGLLIKAGPPAGWEPIPGGKHGGYRRNIGGRYQYWYPSAQHAQQAAKHHEAEGEQARKKLGRMLRRSGAKQEKIEALLEAYSHHSKHAELAQMHHAHVTAAQKKAQAEADAKVEASRTMDEPGRDEAKQPAPAADEPRDADVGSSAGSAGGTRKRDKTESESAQRASTAWLKEYPKGTTHADEEHQKVQDLAEAGKLTPKDLHALREAGHGLHDAHHDIADEHTASEGDQERATNARTRSKVAEATTGLRQATDELRQTNEGTDKLLEESRAARGQAKEVEAHVSELEARAGRKSDAAGGDDKDRAEQAKHWGAKPEDMVKTKWGWRPKWYASKSAGSGLFTSLLKGVRRPFEKGKALPIGTIRDWRGRKMQKTAQGWVPVHEGRQGKPDETPKERQKADAQPSPQQPKGEPPETGAKEPAASEGGKDARMPGGDDWWRAYWTKSDESPGWDGQWRDTHADDPERYDKKGVLRASKHMLRLREMRSNGEMPPAVIDAVCLFAITSIKTGTEKQAEIWPAVSAWLKKPDGQRDIEELRKIMQPLGLQNTRINMYNNSRPKYRAMVEGMKKHPTDGPALRNELMSNPETKALGNAKISFMLEMLGYSDVACIDARVVQELTGTKGAASAKIQTKLSTKMDLYEQFEHALVRSQAYKESDPAEIRVGMAQWRLWDAQGGSDSDHGVFWKSVAELTGVDEFAKGGDAPRHLDDAWLMGAAMSYAFETGAGSAVYDAVPVMSGLAQQSGGAYDDGDSDDEPEGAEEPEDDEELAEKGLGLFTSLLKGRRRPFEKGRALPVGTVRQRKAGAFVKTADGWKPHTGSARGSAKESLASLRSEAATAGVKLDAYSSGGEIVLGRIEVPKAARGQGAGERFMRKLLSLADTHNKTVTLTPSSQWGGSVKKLRAWYKRLGFVDNAGRNKDYAISESMYRKPASRSMAKGKAFPIGTIREWKGKKHIKTADGWKPYKPTVEHHAVIDSAAKEHILEQLSTVAHKTKGTNTHKVARALAKLGLKYASNTLTVKPGDVFVQADPFTLALGGGKFADTCIGTIDKVTSSYDAEVTKLAGDLSTTLSFTAFSVMIAPKGITPMELYEALKEPPKPDPKWTYVDFKKDGAAAAFMRSKGFVHAEDFIEENTDLDDEWIFNPVTGSYGNQGEYSFGHVYSSNEYKVDFYGYGGEEYTEQIENSSVWVLPKGYEPDDVWEDLGLSGSPAYASEYEHEEPEDYDDDDDDSYSEAGDAGETIEEIADGLRSYLDGTESPQEVVDAMLEYADDWQAYGSYSGGNTRHGMPTEVKEIMDSLVLWTAGNVASVRDPGKYVPHMAKTITASKLGYTTPIPQKQHYQRAHEHLKELASAPANRVDPIWRGINLDVEHAKKLTPGSTFDQRAVASFTVNEHITADFRTRAHRDTGNHEGKVGVVFHVKRPKRGTYIDGLSGFPNEDEFVAGGTVTVVKQEWRGEPDRGYWYIECEHPDEPEK